MKTSVSQITTVTQSFAADLDAYRAAGADAVGIWELKLADDSLKRFRASGLEAAVAIPAVPSILPLPLMEGPEDPAERVEAICAGIRRLAPFDPAGVLFLTGPAEASLPMPTSKGAADTAAAPIPAGLAAGGGPGDRAAILEGIRAIAAEGRRSGVRVALEPIQREFVHYWSVVSSLDEAAALLDEAGADDVGLMYDAWHLWNQPLEQIARHRERIAGVHLADWREPTRNTNDRVLPGDGTIDFAPILDALAWDGHWDLEIFSDAELPDSLWKDDPRELARRGVEALRRLFA